MKSAIKLRGCGVGIRSAKQLVALGVAAAIMSAGSSGPADGQTPPPPTGQTAPVTPPVPPAPTEGQPTLPQITVTAPPEAAPRPATRRVAAQPRPAGATVQASAPPAPAPPAQAATPVTAPVTAASEVTTTTQALDTARDALSPKIGTNTYGLDQSAIQALPQGDNTPIEKVLIQAPGVTQDSKAGGDFHVRNEHANVQYRINGIIIPDGVSGFGQLLETSFIGRLDLITGALPAQYGLRTSGIVDITARTQTQNGGSIGIYGGSHGTITPTIDYGGISGQTQFYFTSRGLWNSQGLENPASSINAIHDQSQQGRAFGYTSTLLDPDTRLSTIAGLSIQNYQIPDRRGLMPQFTAFGVSDFNSATLNERQFERSVYGVIALQRKAGLFDGQVSYFTRYSSLAFKPDTIGDLVFNGVASAVTRTSYLNGIQADGSYRIDAAHTLRAGLIVSGEATQTGNTSTLLPVDADGSAIDAPFTVIDRTSKVGWQIGTYIQDEWKLNRELTLNLGLRFDQMYQFVDANQISPRANITWKPLDATTFHLGYARYFTPPSQVLAGPTNLLLVQGTTQEPGVGRADPVLPERSHYFDTGITQKVLPGLEIGVSAYYKIARDLIDDGQFGAAYVLTAFNYDHATNKGVELKANYKAGDFTAYANLAIAQQRATQLVSNQFLFDPDRLAYIANHSVYTDHAQLLTGSAGASYLWDGTRYSASVVMGSGLRSGFANLGHVPGYGVLNLGLSREFKRADGSDVMPMTVRFDVLNVFDHVYQLRDGTGIGVFAPQFGERRAYFVGLSQKF